MFASKQVVLRLKQQQLPVLFASMFVVSGQLMEDVTTHKEKKLAC